MLGLIVFIGIFVAVIIATILTINTTRHKNNEISIETSEFESMLKREGLSDSLMLFCMSIIKRIQDQEGEKDESIISNNVLNQLNGWDYSNVFPEKTYQDIFNNHSKEINELHDKNMNDYGFLPADVGEAKHTEGWSQDAMYTEAIVTQKISDVINKYKREMV